MARPGEAHLPWLKGHVSGFESSPHGVQWMRFDEDAPYPEVVESLPHVAFEVDDLARALEGKEILIPPNSPSPGVTVAMIIDDGALIELLEFRSISDHKESRETRQGGTAAFTSPLGTMRRHPTMSGSRPTRDAGLSS